MFYNLNDRSQVCQLTNWHSNFIAAGLGGEIAATEHSMYMEQSLQTFGLDRCFSKLQASGRLTSSLAFWEDRVTYKISNAVYTLVIAAALSFAIVAQAADGDSANRTPSLEEYKTIFVPTTIKNTGTNDALELVMRRHYLHKYGYTSEVLVGIANSPLSKASVVSSALNDLLTVGGWDLYLKKLNGPYRINFDLKRFKSPETQHGLFKLKVLVAQMLFNRAILEIDLIGADAIKFILADILDDVYGSVLDLKMLEGHLLTRNDRIVVSQFLEAVTSNYYKLLSSSPPEMPDSHIEVLLGALQGVIAVCDLYLTQNRQNPR